MHLDQLLDSVPPTAVWVIVAAVIGLESLGIPLPGEIVLVSATLLASQGYVSPWAVGIAATAGAIIGDSIGYSIGRKGGKPLFDRLGRKFPKHFGPSHLATAERAFQKWGMWAVFFGRFVALLRIFAGPLAGALKMPYWKFLVANALGGVVWAGGTTAIIYTVGKAAEQWLSKFSWIALLVAIAAGITVTLVIKRRTARAAARHEAEQAVEAEEVDGAAPAGPGVAAAAEAERAG